MTCHVDARLEVGGRCHGDGCGSLRGRVKQMMMMVDMVAFVLDRVASNAFVDDGEEGGAMLNE